ncbi:unnamed protein product [Coffea canephora]|uniref:non-specific serine/threonine protein kinase n=1 Tax=Coffea canephora TaxID=49390 RepID=A0A068VI85_COFCA|nr:unnamed protein product [Coffea canephora]
MEVPNTMWGFRSSTLASIFLLLSVAMNFSVSHVSASKQFQNETDRLALLEFKNQIYDGPFGVLNSWNHSQHHCHWEGVTCSARHQRVIALILRHKQLSGTISPHVGNLSFMRFIQLAENQFHGEIPQEFGRLFRLRALNLSSNAIKGKIPIDQLSYLKKLENFYLHANNLTGEIPSSIGNLSSLTTLTAENKLSGIIPASIFNSSAITVISVGGNSFHGNLPTNIGLTLPNLEALGVGGNNFYGNFPSSITNASGLEILDLPYNKFAGQIPTNLGDLTQVKLLNLGNQLSGAIPQGFGNFVNLIQLGLELNSFSGIIPRDFGKLPNLQGLRLDYNDLSGQIVSTLCNNTNLFYLDLSFNQFEGGNIFDNMHSSLMYIKIDENSFSGSLPPEVGKLIHLVDFNVSHNQFAGDIPISLADCSNLENLFMQANFFQGTIPPNLASWKSIQQLDLSINNLTGPIPKELEKLQYLRYLNLSYNDIEGEIPNTGIFSNASQISLIGNNKLCGGVPELEFPPCPVIKGKNGGKLKVVILRSIVVPATLLVLLTVLYFLVYRKRERRPVAGFSSMPARIDELLRLSYHELHRATSGFSPENLIGSGNFGSVYKGRLEKHGNKLVAVKVLDLQKNGASKSFKAECKALRNIRHRNLVSIVSYCSSIDSRGDEFKALVYEFMENGNLDLWLHPAETTDQATSSRSLNLLQKLNIAIDSFLFLLLPNNNMSRNKISEYGMGLAASTQGDVYSYGILLLEMITGRRPTDDIFVGDLDLHNYVNGALHERVSEIVDPLLFLEGDENSNMTPGGETIYGGREIECIISLLKIGLKCSARLPNDRMHMNEVVRKLHLIKDVFLGVRTTNLATNSRRLNLSQKLNIAIDVASALQYLHNHCEAEIVHCDLKPCNILLDNDLVARVGDFGLAMLLPEPINRSSEQGTSSNICCKRINQLCSHRFFQIFMVKMLLAVELILFFIVRQSTQFCFPL